MSADAIVSLLSPGAGRKYDMYAHEGGVGTWGTNNGMAREGIQQASTGVQVYKGAVATLTGEYYRGRSALAMAGAGAGAADYSRYNASFAHNCTCVRPLQTMPDDLAVAAVRVHLAWQNFPAARPLDEMGITIVPHSLDAGMGYALANVGNLGSRCVFGPIDNSTARLICRNGAAGVTVNVNYALPAGLANSWARWELRSVSATQDADAFIVGYINGRQITDRVRVGVLGEVGTMCPIDDGTGSAKGYAFGWLWVSNTTPGGGVKMWYSGMHVCAGPTEAALS